MTKRTFKPVIYSAGDIKWYRSAMMKNIREMNKEVRAEIKRILKSNEVPPPSGAIVVAEDASPVRLIKDALRILSSKWIDRFTASATAVSDEMVDRANRSADMQLQRDAKAEGLTIQYQMTDAMQVRVEAIVAENVSLIKSIPEKYFTEVEGMVYRAVARGGDEHKLVNEIMAGFGKREGITRRRAEFIARDQVRKATSQLSSVRQQAAGIRSGQWVHSAGQARPRHSHVKAGSERREFDLAKGCLIDGAYIMPGELPNCSCTWRPVIPW